MAAERAEIGQALKARSRRQGPSFASKFVYADVNCDDLRDKRRRSLKIQGRGNTLPLLSSPRPMAAVAARSGYGRTRIHKLIKDAEKR